MKWGAPEFLVWLLALLPVAWFMFWRLRRRRVLLERVAAPANLAEMCNLRDRRRRRMRVLWRLGALAALLLALARPQWGFHWEEVKRRGLDILVLADTSRSMLTTDVKPNRLQQAKWGVKDLVARLKGDRIGLVAFAGSSFLQCPLTSDYPVFLMTLDDIYVGLIPRGGTAIEQALRAAIKSFQYGDAASDKALILISDGEDHEGKPLAVLPELKQKNIRVYSIGIGTPEGELVPSENEKEGPFFKNGAGNAVKSALHENILQKLALETGGAYVRAAAGDFGLDRIYDQNIARLKRDEQEERRVKIFEDRFQWFVGLALFALVVEALLLRDRLTREDRKA